MIESESERIRTGRDAPRVRDSTLMPRFSQSFGLGVSQHELDFVDIDTDHDTPVFVDPFAIEVRNDIWAARASEHIRVFFHGGS
jgi:hypothetical protein